MNWTLFKETSVFIVTLTMALILTVDARATTLEDVKKRGVLRCGVGNDIPGFSLMGKDGKPHGFDVDFCRALAAATLGDESKVKYISSISQMDRFPVLQSGDIDLLVRTSTYTLMRDTVLELNFAGVNYYDGQGFMVRKDLGIKSVKELEGATVCVAIGTTTELNLDDYFRGNQMQYTALRFANAKDTILAYEEGRCDALTWDQSALVAWRLTMKHADAHMILPELISKEPLGPVVRHGDDQWLDIVRWTLFAMLDAEENSVSMNTVDQQKATSTLPAIRRLLGVEGRMGEYLGLDKEWAYRIIKQVGNYGEIYERSLGTNTPMKLPRGLNKLWQDGGLQYAMPIR